jgi:hypothetical protein
MEELNHPFNQELLPALTALTWFDREKPEFRGIMQIATCQYFIINCIVLWRFDQMNDQDMKSGVFSKNKRDSA